MDPPIPHFGEPETGIPADATKRSGRSVFKALAILLMMCLMVVLLWAMIELVYYELLQIGIATFIFCATLVGVVGLYEEMYWRHPTKWIAARAIMGLTIIFSTGLEAMMGIAAYGISDNPFSTSNPMLIFALMLAIPLAGLVVGVWYNSSSLALVSGACFSCNFLMFSALLMIEFSPDINVIYITAGSLLCLGLFFQLARQRGWVEPVTVLLDDRRGALVALRNLLLAFVPFLVFMMTYSDRAWDEGNIAARAAPLLAMFAYGGALIFIGFRWAQRGLIAAGVMSLGFSTMFYYEMFCMVWIAIGLLGLLCIIAMDTEKFRKRLAASKYPPYPLPRRAAVIEWSDRNGPDARTVPRIPIDRYVPKPPPNPPHRPQSRPMAGMVALLIIALMLVGGWLTVAIGSGLPYLEENWDSTEFEHQDEDYNRIFFDPSGIPVDFKVSVDEASDKGYYDPRSYTLHVTRLDDFEESARMVSDWHSGMIEGMRVYDVAWDRDGNVVVLMDMYYESSYKILRWTGSEWNQTTITVDDEVYGVEMEIDDNGTLYIAYGRRPNLIVARWDGREWVEEANINAFDAWRIHTIRAFGNGNLYVVYDKHTYDLHIAERVDGVWSDTGMNGLPEYAGGVVMDVLPDGRAAMLFTDEGYNLYAARRTDGVWRVEHIADDMSFDAWLPSIRLDDTGTIHGIYEAERGLCYIRGNADGWHIERVLDAQVAQSDLTIDSNGSVRIFAFWAPVHASSNIDNVYDEGNFRLSLLTRMGEPPRDDGLSLKEMIRAVQAHQALAVYGSAAAVLAIPLAAGWLRDASAEKARRLQREFP